MTESFKSPYLRMSCAPPHKAPCLIVATIFFQTKFQIGLERIFMPKLDLFDHIICNFGAHFKYVHIQVRRTFSFLTI